LGKIPFLRKRKMNSSIPGLLVKTKDIVLANGLHRMKFRQSGQIPDVEAIWKKHGPRDGQAFVLKSWMDLGIGYVYLAWKEWRIDPLPGIQP
jgi:hypothetical protein